MDIHQADKTHIEDASNFLIYIASFMVNRQILMLQLNSYLNVFRSKIQSSLLHSI